MKTIYKYPVEMSEDFTVKAPRGAYFFEVQLQNGSPQMWARVETENPDVLYQFGVYGTGHEIKEFAATSPHVGTFQLAEGTLVFHLFGGIYK